MCRAPGRAIRSRFLTNHRGRSFSTSIWFFSQYTWFSMGHHESFPDGPQSKILFSQICVSFRNIQVLFCRYIDVYIHVFIGVCVRVYVSYEFASERHKDSFPHNIYIYTYIHMYIYINIYVQIYIYDIYMYR